MVGGALDLIGPDGLVNQGLTRMTIVHVFSPAGISGSVVVLRWYFPTPANTYQKYYNKVEAYILLKTYDLLSTL